MHRSCIIILIAHFSANGGYHHHGGFLGGYYNFFRGSSTNPRDNFSNKYDTGNGGEVDEEDVHHDHVIREPVFQEVDPRLLLTVPENRNSSTFYIQKLLDSFHRK